jgi:hypothetical protein
MALSTFKLSLTCLLLFSNLCVIAQDAVEQQVKKLIDTPLCLIRQPADWDRLGKNHEQTVVIPLEDLSRIGIIRRDDGSTVQTFDQESLSKILGPNILVSVPHQMASQIAPWIEKVLMAHSKAQGSLIAVTLQMDKIEHLTQRILEQSLDVRRDTISLTKDTELRFSALCYGAAKRDSEKPDMISFDITRIVIYSTPTPAAGVAIRNSLMCPVPDPPTATQI